MIELKIGQLNTDNAQNGNVLTYVAANGVVEYRDIVSEIDARIVANVNTVQNNVTALDNNAWVNANDYATYITVTTNTYNTYASLIAYVDGEVANLVSGAPATLDTLNELAAALGNDANLSVTLTGMIGNVASNAATNATAINTVQENVASLDTTVTANTYNTYTTLTANIYNTYTSLNANIDSVQANVYALTLDTVATNGNVTTASIEVAGLLSSGDLTVSGPTTLNSNVVINGMIDSIDRIQFNTSIATDTAAGVLAWNSDIGTLQVGLTDAVTVKIGEDSYFYVRAAETLSRGNVVYASGVVGGSGKIDASKFIANNSIEERYVIGIAAEDISSGNFGYVISLGTVRGLDASGALAGETWLEGDVLYASSTIPGGLTRNQPEAPNQDIAIAFVTSNNSSSGSIAVRAYDLGYHVGELHDVYDENKSDGDVLTYVSGNARWEPKSVSADESNLYNTYTTVTGLIDTVQDNVTSLTSTVDSIDANIYNTYNTLSGFIDTVQDNVSSGGTTSNVTIFTASDLFTVSTSNTFNLSRTVNNARDIFVSLSGVTQYPGVGYTVSDNVLTISNTAPLKQGLEIEVRHLIGEAGTRGNSWQEISSSALLNARSRVIVDSSSTAITLTLPSSPLLGDEVRIIDGAGNVSNNAITLYGNGSNIEADSSNVVVDVDRSAFTLVYYNTYHGWVFGEK